MCFVYPFISWWTFELFHFQAVINNAAVNTPIEVFTWAHVSKSFETTPKHRITGSYGNSLLNILKNYQTSCIILHSHQQHMKVFILRILKSLFCIYWEDCGLFVIYSFNMIYYLDWCPYVELTLHSWNKPSFGHGVCVCVCVCVCVKFSQSCPTLYDPTDYTVHGILQARTLEWVAFPFSRRSSQPRDWTQVSRIAGGFFTSWATREALGHGI